MEVNFRAERGLCPYFIYGNTKFFIKDSRDTRGMWVYTLYSKSLKKELMQFENQQEAVAYIIGKKGVRKIGSSKGKEKTQDAASCEGNWC